MQRWAALVEIVKSFNERGSPKLAFASVLLFVLVPVAVIALAIASGVPSLIGGR